MKYDLSTRKVCDVLGVELAEINKWVCCGSSPAHQCDELMSVALPAQNMVLAEAGGLKDICAPCASCYSRLKVAQERLKEADMKKDVEQVLAAAVPDDLNVLHILDVVMEKVGLDVVAEKVVKNLGGVKVACYYGCLMTRPPKVTGKRDFENPTDMESVMDALGATALDWNLKTFCCGASFALTQTDVVLELTKKILADAEAVEADVIAVGCPLCHANLDGRQPQINDKFNTNFNIPIMYFTELMGLAFGIKPKELGLFKHLTEVDDFLKERALI
ncbi:MAG: CoB--CoM heterodisulfide reductase iron-sulfur subunit B family protein [Planctomycetota bacterium]|jgi:heterodisulfide reductase subunit B